MKTEAATLCDAAESFQAACNELHRVMQGIDDGESGLPMLEDVMTDYSESWRSLVKAIYYMRKAM